MPLYCGIAVYGSSLSFEGSSARDWSQPGFPFSQSPGYWICCGWAVQLSLCLQTMCKLDRVFWALMEEGGAARAHFHTWWALRNLALPDHLSTMNNYKYVDFFHVSNSGNYKLFFVALSKIYARDGRTAGMQMLKEELRKAGYSDIADEVDRRIDPHEPLVRKVLNIRNKSISHNQADLPREQVYQINGVTPNEIRNLIDITCETINFVSNALGKSNVISGPERHERAVLKMLETLDRGQT